MASTIVTHKEEDTLKVTLYSAFNLRTKNVLMSHLNADITKLILDMNRCNRIDSEGVIFLHRWQKSGKKLELIDPPAILFEILDILELSEAWNPDLVVTH